MQIDSERLISVLKNKREVEGLSVRALSKIIGVSFSSLARIERGEGKPDNNSAIRILEWLGEDARSAGLGFENVALVHFRAAKNAQSKTIQCLLSLAQLAKREFTENLNEPSENSGSDESTILEAKATAIRSKQELEELAGNFRESLELSEDEALEALSVRIGGVDVFTPSQLVDAKNDCLDCLLGESASEWSAMSVPLDMAMDRWAIIRNDSHELERQRVTYLEEIWHIWLGHKLTKISKVADSYGRTFDAAEEHDAFYLTAASLLPESSVKNAVKSGETAQEIARKFGVSIPLVEYRIKRLGLWAIYKQKKVTIETKSERGGKP